MTADALFVDDWRRRKSAAFDLTTNSTAHGTISVEVFGTPREIYANANLSIYSAQPCNARCAFCVEELRPASRGASLQSQKTTEPDDARYFDALSRVLRELRPLSPTLSVTGGEPSKDPRLPSILRVIAATPAPRRTLTTNGSGLLDEVEGQELIESIVTSGIDHLNISRAHFDHDRNATLMGLRDGLSDAALQHVVHRATDAGTRVRLSCVLLTGAIDSVDGIIDYLTFAEHLGVDNVIFRQLMKTDPTTFERNYVIRYSDRHRAPLEPILDRLHTDPRFQFRKQIVGYYYYVEVWKYRGIDLVFEEADLARLEQTKQEMPGVIHELIFHPNARLSSTWQPWEGDLGPDEP